MRDPERITEFTNKLRSYWADRIPDWRFGQFISNFFGFIFSRTDYKDVFFIEDEEMSALLDDFFSSFKNG